MSIQIQLRRGTAALWTSVNPTVASGEFGVETDTLKIKIGDGATTWNSLAYYPTSNAYRVSFVNGDLVAGVLTVTHSIGQKIVAVQVYNNSDKLTVSDDVTLVDLNSLTIDLSSFGVILGTWNVIVTA